MATDSDPPMEPPPSSLAGSVDLNRGSEVHQSLPIPLSAETEVFYRSQKESSQMLLLLLVL